MSDIFDKLKAPFPPEKISWRVGSTKKDKSSGLALAYIDARDVMQRLDDVVEPQSWQCEYVPMPNGSACCRIGISVEGLWVWKSNGAENLTDSDKPDAKEMAIKGTYSDAFKRAAVLWGVGRYLYELPNVWVDLEPYGNSFKIKAGQEWKLEKALNGVAHYEEEPENITSPVVPPSDEPPSAAYLEKVRKKAEVTDWSKGPLNDLVAMPADERAAWLLKDENYANLLWAKINWPRLYECFTELGVSVEENADAPLAA